MKITFNDFINEGITLKLKKVFKLEDIWNKAANDVYRAKDFKTKPTFDEVHALYHRAVHETLQKGDYIKFTTFYSGSPNRNEDKGIIHDIRYAANNADIYVRLENHTEFFRWNTFTNDGYTDYTDYRIYMKGEVKIYDVIREYNENDPYGEEEWN